MATQQTIVDAVFLRLRNHPQVEVTIPQVQSFINDAVYAARRKGSLLHMEDDESLEFAASTWEYAVPDDFVYVHSLRVENDTDSPSTWDEPVPNPFWEIRINGGSPYFYITRAWGIPDGKAMKVIGQKRLTLYTAGATGLAETVDPGMESYLTEMALHHALMFQASGSPTLEYDRSRFEIARESLFMAERMLASAPMEFRVLPDSKLVPGR